MVAISGLDELFSGGVHVVESRDDELDDSLLWPAERAAIGEVVAGRWWDWVTGRRCARLAMGSLGVEPEPVLTGERREPLWPDGVVGAITHTAGYAAAAVASDSSHRSVGIDAEPDAPLPDGVLRRVASEDEQRHLARLADTGVAHPDRVLFCAKEAIYKSWFPLARRWLGFEDAAVHLRPDGGFEAEIRVPGPLTRVTGRWGAADGVVMVAIEVH